MNESSETIFCFNFNLDLKEMEKDKNNKQPKIAIITKHPQRRLNGSQKYRWAVGYSIQPFPFIELNSLERTPMINDLC